MSGRNCVNVVVVLVVTVLATSSARAQRTVVGVDGCDILETLVYTAVIEAGFRRSRPSGDTVYPGSGDVTICNRTIHAVTSAFTSAMREMNAYVSWGLHRGTGGEYCQSHVLSQCYPGRNPYMPPPSATERQFVVKSWYAISGAVRSTMATAPGADISRFDQAQLRFGIKSRLAMHRLAGEPADTGFWR